MARELPAVRHLPVVSVRNLLQQKWSPLLQVRLRQVSPILFCFLSLCISSIFSHIDIKYLHIKYLNRYVYLHVYNMYMSIE